MEMYFIAQVLPASLNEKVLRYKQMMLDRFNCRVGLRSPAHITLVPPFWLPGEKENDVMNAVDEISGKISSFPIATHHFSAFKPRTIFIAVAPNEKLVELKKETDHVFRAYESLKVKIDERPFHPHITIATRDLLKKSFYEIWPWFAEKELLLEWMAEGISVLRHNKKNWDVVYTSQFQHI